MLTSCEICGSDYDQGVEVVMYGQPHRLHNFTCAIQALAPGARTASVASSDAAGRLRVRLFAVMTARALRGLRLRFLTS